MDGATVRLVAAVLARLPRLAWAATSVLYQLWRGRRGAVRSFYLTMRRGGVPDGLALELSRYYPRLELADMLASRKGGRQAKPYPGRGAAIC